MTSQNRPTPKRFALTNYARDVNQSLATMFSEQGSTSSHMKNIHILTQELRTVLFCKQTVNFPLTNQIKQK